MVKEFLLTSLGFYLLAVLRTRSRRSPLPQTRASLSLGRRFRSTLRGTLIDEADIARGGIALTIRPDLASNSQYLRHYATVPPAPTNSWPRWCWRLVSPSPT